MRLFVIRHAPTEVNRDGVMVKDYDSFGILPFDKELWWRTVGANLPKDIVIFTSPVLRTQQTAQKLFAGRCVHILEELRDFDCSGLADKKFWEISEEEFEKDTGLNRTILNDRVEDIIYSLIDKVDINANVVLITHGYTGRAILNYYHQTNLTALDILKSKLIEFSNLDMFEIEHAEIKNTWKFNQ